MEDTLVMNSFYGRVEDFCLNENKSDISVYVGENKESSSRMPAHKLILSLISPVFAQMFEGNFLERMSNEIIITDVSPSTFRHFLTYVYTGNLRNLTAMECIDMLYVADKYSVLTLRHRCFEHLSTCEVTPDNFWYLFEAVRMFDKDVQFADVWIKLLKYLDFKTEVLLRRTEFENLTTATVLMVVKRDSLGTSEILLFDQILCWAKAECCRQKMIMTSSNERLVLGDIFYNIRFLTMLNELRRGPFQSGLFTDEEKNLLLSQDLMLWPWDRELLSRKRKQMSCSCWNFDKKSFKTIDVLQKAQSKTIVFAFAKRVILKSLDIFVMPEDGEINMECEMSELNGNDKRLWYLSKELQNDSKEKIGVPIFCKKYVGYKMRVMCFKGRLLLKAINCRWGSYMNERLFYVGILEDGNDTLEELSTKENWKSFFEKENKIPEAINHTARFVAKVKIFFC